MDKQPYILKNELTGEAVSPQKYREPVLHNEPRPEIDGVFADLVSGIGNFLLRITGQTQPKEPIETINSAEEAPPAQEKKNWLPFILIGGGIILLFFFMRGGKK